MDTIKIRESFLKSFIQTLFDLQERTIKAQSLQLKEEYTDAELINHLQQFESAGILTNTSIVNRCANYLQLLNDEENIKQTSLVEIEQLFRASLKIQPDDLSLREDLAVFLEVVLDRPEDAKKVLSEGILLAEEKIKRMKLLMQDLNSTD